MATATRTNLIDIGETAIRIHDLLRESEGELTPDLEAAMDEMLASGRESLDAAAWVVRQLEGSKEVCDLESKRYKYRSDSIQKQIDSLKGRMLFPIEAAFSGKLKTERNTIWAQTSADTVGFELKPDADLERLAKENGIFVRRKYELDKIALRNRYDAGDDLPSEIAVVENPGKTFLRIK